MQDCAGRRRHSHHQLRPVRTHGTEILGLALMQRFPRTCLSSMFSMASVLLLLSLPVLLTRAQAAHRTTRSTLSMWTRTLVWFCGGFALLALGQLCRVDQCEAVVQMRHRDGDASRMHSRPPSCRTARRQASRGGVIGLVRAWNSKNKSAIFSRLDVLCSAVTVTVKFSA